jgi:uncharacterized C2H2 Zn-finger protein
LVYLETVCSICEVHAGQAHAHSPGRVDPIPFTVKSDQTGLGKLSQDVEMIETTVSQRRDMESERWAKQSREQKQQLQVHCLFSFPTHVLTTAQEDAARKAALHDSISDTLRPFYCALCDKQFKNVAQYDEHTNSYAHAHKVREKDMKASLRIGADAEERKEKERKREERELRKLAKAQGVRMSKASVVQDPAPPTDTTPVVPIPVESEAKPSGWNTVGSTTAPAPARGWAVVGASGPAPVATPAFRTAGWSSLEAGTTSQPPPNTSGPAPSQGGWASIATSIPAAAPLPPSGGWSTLSAPAAVHLPQAAAAPSPLERPQQPEPEPNAAVALMNAAASSPVPRPQRPAPEPKPDRENKRAGWQNFRAGKAGRR